MASADHSPAKFHRFSFDRWALLARYRNPTCQSGRADSPADCCCYCYSALSVYPLRRSLTANDCYVAVLRVAIVTVGARFPIHLIVRLACPNPNEFHRCVCMLECLGDVIEGGEKETETGESRREKNSLTIVGFHQNTKVNLQFVQMHKSCWQGDDSGESAAVLAKGLVAFVKNMWGKSGLG